MAWRDWFSRKTRLELAIERGCREGASLADEVRGLDDYPVRSRQDAEAICNALQAVLARATPFSAKSSITSDLHALTGLFQDVDGAECDAFEVLAGRGTELLIETVEAGLASPERFDASDLLFVLKILAMYGAAPGTDMVIRAARHPLEPGGYLWSVILGAYSATHTERERLFATFRERLPSDFIAMALLDAANQARLSGGDFPHPFDTAEGQRHLERWLANSEEDESSYAVSAAASLPFLSPPGRDRLLAIAMDHAHAPVQMEAAWAAVKLGREAGIKCLARFCLDVNYSDQAKRYLTELERANAIPTEASTPDVAAKAEFAQWLAHPNELGRPPDELEIIDHRVLAWPPEGERIPAWLIKYRVRATSALENDKEEVGFVGSMTFCLFSYRLTERPPEDGYAIHCCWELQGDGLISESEVGEPRDEYDQMLSQWKGEALTEPQILNVVELSPKLRYPQQLVAVASARRDGAPGCVVLDGPRSAWYPAAEMPDNHAPTVWKIHIGRFLLGFQGQPDRQRFLKPALPEPAPEAVIEAYKRLLSDAASGNVKRQERLLTSYGPISRHWEKYVAAVEKVSGDPRSACVARCYEKVLHLATHAPESIRRDALDSFSAAGEHFSAYVDALADLGRKVEISLLVEMFRPLWEHNLGFGRLGAAAFRAGEDATAEALLTKLRNSLEEYFRAEEMPMLAEIWQRRGETAKARDLLTDCLEKLVAKNQTVTGSDRESYEEYFQHQRTAFLRLFPTDGESVLRRLGIPDSTL